MSNDVKIGVKATLDDSSAAAAAAALGEKLNAVAQKVSQSNKIKFNPIDKATIDDLKKIEAKFVELTRISGGLRQRIRATGQSGSSLADLDWERLYEDPAIRVRKMQQAFRHATAGTAFAGAFQGGGAGGGSGGSGGGRGGGGIGAAVGKIAGSAASATGTVGGSIAGAIGHGIQNGIGAGIGFGVVDLLSKAIGGTISMVKEKVDAAGQEGISYDTLKRSLGDVNVSFNLLRESLRAASYDISTTFEETQKLGSDFAKLSGITKIQYKTLADEVAVGGSFGRSFGLDPSQSNQFFAQMRQFGATANTQDSRKLALMIGEAVTRSGATTKTDELLQVIASYTATQSRNGLAGANVVGYSGMLSGLVGAGVPGLDPQGAAALLGRVNASISGGGGAGEAGQNFLYRVLGARNGLDPVQAMLLQQQGAFGTGRQAFGAGSLYSRFSAKFGGGAGGAAGSDQTNLAAILSETQRQYAGNPSLMLNATARLLGINENQAMALHTIGPNQLGGMVGRMGRLGLDLTKLNGSGISALAGIESGQDLGAQANALLGNRKNPLTADQAAQLRSALGGGDQEKLKDILTELTYTRGQEQTEGSKTRDALQGLDKRLQELATGLIGPTNDMRNAMVYLAGGGKKTASQINKEMANLAYEETTAPLKSRRAEIEKQLATAGQFKSGVRGHKWTDAELAQREQTRAALLAERAQIDKQLDAAVAARDFAYNDVGSSGHAASGATPERLAALAAADRELGLAPGTSAGLFQTESGFNGNAVSRKGARGFAQIMPSQLATMNKRFGRNMDPSNFNDSLAMYKNMMKENMDHFGGDQGMAIRGYQGGWDTSAWGSENAAYLPSVMKNASLYANAMPEGAGSGAAGAGDGTAKVEVTVISKYPNGQQSAAPATVTTKVRVPRAQGQ